MGASHTYGSAVNEYLACGWKAVIPVDINGEIGKVPRGLTGASRIDPTPNQVRQLVRDFADAELGLALPLDVVGFDVDNYGDKRGAETLEKLEDELGRLPVGPMSTARGHGKSGIRFFCVPAEFSTEGLPNIGKDVDLIRHGWRWARVWPSRNPKTGSQYRWHGASGQLLSSPPRPTDFPLLPEAWLAWLETRRAATTAEATELGEPEPFDQDAHTWLVELLDADSGATDDGTGRHRRSSQLAYLAAEKGLTRAQTHYALRLHEPTIAKLNQEHGHTDGVGALRYLERTVNRAFTKHNHEGQTCEAAGCPEKPTITTVKPAAPHEEKPKARTWIIRSPDDHDKPIPPRRWLVKNVWEEGSHGPIAGGSKTFKTYNAQALAIAIGSGVDYLGRFPVIRSGPVLYFIGEGGYEGWQRRHNRICQAYGIKPKDSNVFAIAETAPVNSPEFAEAVEAAKSEVNPLGFFLDPLYAYHPQGIEAQNLYSRGKMLAELDSLIGHDRALFIPDHMKKPSQKQTTEQRLDLDEISQAGMSQWADSWILHSHREPYDRLAGIARLAVEYGSRRGYSRRFALDFTVGTFNEDTGDCDGPFSWEVTPLEELAEAKTSGKASAAYTGSMLHQRLLETYGTGYVTKSELVEFCRTLYDIGKTQAYSKVTALEKSGYVRVLDSKKRTYVVAEEWPLVRR